MGVRGGSRARRRVFRAREEKKKQIVDVISFNRANVPERYDEK